MNQEFDLDLSVVEVPSARVKMPDGTSIVVKAPSFQSLIRLGSLVKEWRNKSKESKSKEMREEELFSLIEDLIKKIESIIPEVKGYDLSLENLMKIVNLCISLAKPSDMKELERRGISVDVGSQKKSIG